LGEKEALAFLKKSNKSIIKAWENYKSQIGHSEHTKLNDVFKQMFKAWTLSNQKAIDLLEDKHKKIVKKTQITKEKKPEKINQKSN
jgi:predicted transcriptional regulator